MDKNEKKVKLFKIGHLFTGGYGSFTFAVKKIGIDYINEFGCELMAPQIECYDKNHGSPKKWFVDITKTDFSEYFGKIDMLQGSPVCKSYSMAGQREGLDSSDGMLMDETIRAIAEIQPETFIIENSASLTSVNGGADWDLILKQFNKLEGYTISWGKMNEKDYGIPQNRNRLFIIGFRAKISQFNFPHKQKLKLALIDLLEQHVPKKYFLSMKMLNGFKAHKERHDGKGNGFGMKLTDPNGICGAVSTKCGNRQTDPFIDRLDLVKLGNIAASGHDSLWGRVYDPKGIACNQNASGGGAGAKTGLYIRSNTRIGFEVAEVGDSLNTAYATSKTRRGRVGKGISQSLTTAPEIHAVRQATSNIVTFFETSKDARFISNTVSRLTPREQSRVMGDIDDKFIMDGFSDTKLSEFIGNAIGLGTMVALVKEVHRVQQETVFSDPIRQTLESLKTIEQPTLF